MRVLNFSDLHGHAFKPYSELHADGVNSRLRDAINILGEIEALCQQYAVDGVLCAGDLFHARSILNVRTFNAIYEAVARVKMHVDFFGLIVGNHDQTDKEGKVYSTHTLSSVVHVMGTLGWRVVSSQGEQLNVLAVPYDSEKDYLVNQINKLAPNPQLDAPSVLLGHFGISGGKVGANFVLVDEHEVNLAEIPHDQFDQVFLGHYHLPQKLLPNVRFLGATHQHNWGDADQDRGCWLWDTTPDQEFSEPTFIPLQTAPKFIQLPYDAVINAKTDLREIVDSNFTRVVCPAWLTVEQWAEAAQLVVDAGARKVEPWAETVTANAGEVEGEFHPGMDFEDMIEQYVVNFNTAPALDSGRLIGLGQAILKEVS